MAPSGREQELIIHKIGWNHGKLLSITKADHFLTMRGYFGAPNCSRMVLRSRSAPAYFDVHRVDYFQFLSFDADEIIPLKMLVTP